MRDIGWGAGNAFPVAYIAASGWEDIDELYLIDPRIPSPNPVERTPLNSLTEENTSPYVPVEEEDQEQPHRR